MGKLNLLTINEVVLLDKNGQEVWRAENLYNILHSQGEQYVLTAAFNPGSIVPSNFYFGLDDRVTLTAADVMSSLIDEPTVNGYSRQFISSSGGFTIEIGTSGFNEAVGGVLSFSASGGNWGSVRNLFLTDKLDNTGLLMASVALPDPLTVTNGSTINMRMTVALQDLP